MQSFFGTKKIHAEPAEKDGQPGYKVVYPDGYESWSPKGVFESAYHPTDAMLFGHAIEAMKDGQKVARRGWNGKDMWVALQVPDAHSKMGLPYAYMKTVDNALVPWVASHSDMLAGDWFILD